jgi:hypothetical protein
MKAWWKAAGIRAVKTFAQSLVATIPVGVTITEVSWQMCLGVAALAAVLSLLTSIAGLPELNPTDHDYTVLERKDEQDEQVVVDDSVEVEEEEL